MAGNAYGFGVFGESLTDFMNSIDASNCVDGKPILYFLNESNVVVDSEAGYVGLVNCRNMTVEDLTLDNNINGLLLAYTFNSTIVGNYVTKNQLGICLTNSSNNLLDKNTVLNNDCGVCFNRSSTNSMLDNSIANNQEGIFFLESCINKVARNDMIGNHICMNLSDSSNNLIYHNNFTSNEIQPSSSDNSPNAWDSGYPFGGNYWSDQHGNDTFSGSNQNETGSDGICDTPYDIVANNRDKYPLMSPWTPPEIAVSDLQLSKTILGRGCVEAVNVSFENLGVKIEAFTAAIYSNSTLTYSEQFTIGMANLTISLDWNSSEFAYGVYTLRVYAEPCLEETNTANNSTAIANLTLTIPGDLTCDFSVDVYDAIRFAGSFGSRPGSSNWNPNADFDSNNIVDIYDALILAGNFGKSVQV
jgi:parallel beta-helix repeat protein